MSRRTKRRTRRSTRPTRTRSALEAPERGSADELLDAGAHGELDAMRHSTAHVMAEAVLDLFPGTKLGIGPAIAGRLLLRLRAAPPAHARRPRGDRGADARERRGRPPVRAQRDAARRRAAPSSSSASQPFKVEILDDLAAQGRARRRADAADDLLRARPVHRPVPGPARRVAPGKIGPFKLLGRRRRVLARRREAPDAPAHLRHGLGDPGGARPVPVAARGGEEARPPPAGRPARPVQLPRRLARARPSGTPRASGSGGRSRARCASSRTRRGYQEISTPILVREKLWRAVGPLGPATRDNMFLRRVRGPDVQPQADELPRVARSSTDRDLRSYRDLPLRFNEYGRLHRNERSGTLSRPDPRPPVHPGRRPHLRPAGPAGGRDRGAPRRGPRGVRLVRARAALRVRDASRTRRSATRRCGSGPRRLIKEALDRVRRRATWSSPRTARSTRPRSTSTSTTRSAASGRWRRSRST